MGSHNLFTSVFMACAIALVYVPNATTLDVRPGNVGNQNMDNDIPNIFPEDDTKYKIIQANETLVKLLTEPSKDNSTLSEIFDMLHGRDDEYITKNEATFISDMGDDRGNMTKNVKMQVEVIQSEGTVVEKDNILSHYAHERSDEYHNGYGLRESQLIGIAICLTLTTVIFGYLGHVIWKRYYWLKRSSKHELLHNEEGTVEMRIEQQPNDIFEDLFLGFEGRKFCPDPEW